MTRALSAEEQQELAKLQAVIQQATADGKLTQAERQQITATMRADGKVTYEELALIRQLISDKVAAGELTLDD